jgi:AAA family ATP:ADP antiporter
MPAMPHVSGPVGPPPSTATAGLRRAPRPRWRGRAHELSAGRAVVIRHQPQRAPAWSSPAHACTHTRAGCPARAALALLPATVAHATLRQHAPRQVRCGAGLGGGDVTAAAATQPSPALPAVLRPLAGLWQKLLLMGSLFFFMAYNNALLDSLKDTLTVTALGGAEQIPFLTVWAVLPCSILFVLGFSALSTRLPRRTLFNATLGLFLGFYAVFTYLLFPLRAQLAPTELTSALMAVLPVGLHGGVAVLHNWTYTLFYCFSELWGDVVLSLLFWGLANDITLEEEAMVLYPLFGLGANVAQAVAGRVLKLLSVAPVYAAGMSLAAKQAAGEAAWALQLRLLMVSVFVSGAAIFALHAVIVRASSKWKKAAAPEAGAASPAALPGGIAPVAKPRMRTRDAFKALSASPQILCLAAMSVAQGLSSNVFQVAWKTQLRQLYPEPSSYCAFMGDVATVSAVATFAAMLAAPALFRRLGWTGAASVTPYCMVVLGWLFFGLSIAAGAGVGASFGLSHASVLRVLVAGGAAVYVFEKAAKFSLFKPAEEVIYLGSSPEVKTQGKAAVDVCATQLGKAGGSIFQQAIVVAFGSLAKAFHILALAHTTCCLIWLAAVGALAHHHGHLLANLRGGGHSRVVAPAAVPEPYTDGPACDVEDSEKLKQAAGLV